MDTSASVVGFAASEIGLSTPTVEGLDVGGICAEKQGTFLEI